MLALVHHTPLSTWPLVLLVASLVFIALFALLAVYAERKVAAWIQDRMGPVEVGPHGLLQTLADILKLLQKETILPAGADKWLFLLAPLVVFVAVFTGFAVIPWAPGIGGAITGTGLLFLLAIISVDVIGLLMAGWASHSKYALLGSFRAVSQIISYEIPAGLCLLSVVLLYGTLNLDIISQQQGLFATRPVYLWGLVEVTAQGGVFAWSIFQYPHLIPVFVLFLITALAEANRAPFDIPEAESELVSGFHVEYSGFRFAVLMLAEYAMMLLLSLLAAILFLGGWNTPLPNITSLPPGIDPFALDGLTLLSNLQFATLTTGAPGSIASGLWGAFWLLLKGTLLVGVMMWVRWTLPRLRADQLLTLCWKYLIPFSFTAVLLSILWKAAA
ncbi:MAG: NADH-quinone oxidoreductase subunit H [Bacteroidetes bacterium]|nr:NADH-quinone oxidoreductase subunit H [Bacteroidota bacterium]